MNEGDIELDRICKVKINRESEADKVARMVDGLNIVGERSTQA